MRASAMVRLTTVQPLAAAPTLALDALPGRAEALALTPCTVRRDSSLPSAPVTADLDAAVVPGASGVLLGEFRNAMFLMPISDPAALTASRCAPTTIRQSSSSSAAPRPPVNTSRSTTPPAHGR